MMSIMSQTYYLSSCYAAILRVMVHCPFGGGTHFLVSYFGFICHMEPLHLVYLNNEFFLKNNSQTTLVVFTSRSSCGGNRGCYDGRSRVYACFFPSVEMCHCSFTCQHGSFPRSLGNKRVS